MKTQVRLALLCLAASTAPAFAQSTPQCGTTNYDQARNSYTIINPAAGAVNQQCFITVYPTGATPAMARQYPASYLIEGSYAIELSGGGGGGGSGAQKDKGGGGGGAGAAPSRSDRFLAPGEYRLTIGTGGAGGTSGAASLNGNPTNMVNVGTGQLVAGFAGADRASATSSAGAAGRGGVGAAGGSTGGSGGDSGVRSEEPAQAGSMSASAGTAMPGQAGSETGRTARTSDGRTVQANAGGGGGAGVGTGGSGASAGNSGSAERGRQGGGGGGGSGAVNFSGPGASGGNGFIRLALTALAPQPVAAAAPAAPAAVAVAPLVQKYSMSSDALFSSGRATLRPEGKTRLNDLVSRLKTVDIDTILSTGHSDRIGASEPNQRLSMQRAETVKAYLVSQGIQSYRNAAVGMGEYQPVTNANDCKGASSPKVIACLQPDRRVDVEVVVSKRI